MRCLPIVILLGLATGAAIAAVPEVRQAGRMFSPTRLMVAKGSAVHFVNDENVVHHAYVDTPQFAADSGDIPPGESKDILFTRVGAFVVRCAIHPNMQMLIEVSE